MKICRITLSFILAIAMTLTMMPWLGGTADNAYAETDTANGGTVLSNSEADAKAAFGSDNVTAVYNNNVLTITLNKDIKLDSPVTFKKGSSGDTIVLNLSGNSIKGADGTDSSEDSAAGRNAIEIIAADFDVVINGSGSIVGGDGVKYETDMHMKYGARGGDAVCFAGNANGSYWNPQADDAELKYGLTVDGGAVITGGSGADLTGDDWIYNIENYDGEDKYKRGGNPQFTLTAGAGGAGIGQTGAGIAGKASTLSYAKITIINGKIKGGAGGDLDMGTDNAPVLTHYGLMTNSVIDAYMQGIASEPEKAYDDLVEMAISLNPGNGGDGILLGAGRKYLHVEQSASVTGGSCGTMEYGKSKLVSSIGNETAAAGNGIGVYGDIGLKNVETSVTEDNWNSKNANSDDMGIYIEGTVKGGGSPDADAVYESCGRAGKGIVLQGSDDYESSINYPVGEEKKIWGIVEVAQGGTVSGGYGGTSLFSSAGAGGEGIIEAYTKSPDPLAGYYSTGTDFYIVKGTVKGGNGGSAYGLLPSSGSGGNGLSFGNYRKGVNVFGNGVTMGGDCGLTVNNGATGNDDEREAAEGIRFYPEDEAYYENTVMNTVRRISGSEPGQQIEVDNSGLSVTASMTPLDNSPTYSTTLSCSVTKPAGYNGDVSVKWHVEFYDAANGTEGSIIEPSGTNGESFKLRSDEQYKWLSYLTYPSYPSLGHSYNVNVATADRIIERLGRNNSTAKIWCNVVLSDGRYAKSNVINLPTSGEDPPGPSEGDQEKVLAVINAIEALNDVTLADAEAVSYARELFNALTETQINIMGSSQYNELRTQLEAAENRIQELTDEAYDVAENVIYTCLDQLPSDYSGLDPNDPENEAAILEYKGLLEDAIEAYNNLSPEQRTLIENYLAEFSPLNDYLSEAVAAYNEAFPDYAINEDIEEPAVNAKLITADMVSVANATYTGKALSPAVTVKDGNTVLKKGVDYTVQYKNNKKVGKGTAIIVAAEGSQNYKGQAEKTFKINPKGATIVAPKAAKKALTAKWKKQSTKMSSSRITGYQVQVAKNKKFTSGKKTKTVKGYSKTSVKVTGLKAKTKYYVRVRTYMKVSGSTYYSNWSGVKSVKVK